MRAAADLRLVHDAEPWPAPASLPVLPLDEPVCPDRASDLALVGMILRHPPLIRA